MSSVFSFGSGGGNATKLGGKSAESYIQSNPNLLANGDFKLNTQGVISRSTDGYICDGWKADIEANTNVIWNEDGSVTIDLTNATYSGEIYQLVEAFTNDEMIMSAEINGIKYSVSGTNGNFSKYISVDGKTIAWLGCLITNGLLKYRLFAYAGYKVTFKNAKLEIGNVATPFSPTTTYEEYVKMGVVTGALTPNNFPSNLNNNSYKQVYVSPSGSDDNDGLSASTPMKSIDKAINKFKGAYNLILSLVSGEYTMSGEYSGFHHLQIKSSSINAIINIPSTVYFIGSSVSFDTVTLNHTGEASNMISLSYNTQMWVIASTVTATNCKYTFIVGAGSFLNLDTVKFDGVFNRLIHCSNSIARVYNCTKTDTSSITSGLSVTRSGLIIENCSQSLGSNVYANGGQIISTSNSIDYTTTKPRLMSLTTTTPTTITNGAIVGVYE